MQFGEIPVPRDVALAAVTSVAASPRLRALLPLILMRLQPLQLALFQTSEPSALCSLFQSLL